MIDDRNDGTKCPNLPIYADRSKKKRSTTPPSAAQICCRYKILPRISDRVRLDFLPAVKC